MKSICFLLLFFPVSGLLAQDIRNHNALTNPQSVHPQSAIRAVVVGISDYQSPQIPDLQFADRDAEAFAAWLRSPAGGSVPERNLVLLTNAQATTAQFAKALDYLIDQSQPGDQTVIYFAGHGDVESKTKNQMGFLLSYDSPPTYYMSGAYALVYLQDIITTLSVQKKTKVLFIADACHAGKLAGSSISGTQITAANLAIGYANETKILSCQPNEFSLEGLQWGGGRSAFSFRLLEGLYGLADQNDDGIVTLFEIDRYLENTVPNDVMPASQIPMTIGDKETILAVADPELTAVLRHNQEHAGFDIPLAPGHINELPHNQNAAGTVVCAPCTYFYQKLEQALRDKSPGFGWLIQSPELTPLGSDAKVRALLNEYAPGGARD